MEHFDHEVGEHRVKSKGERAKYFVQFNILTEGTLRTQNVTFFLSKESAFKGPSVPCLRESCFLLVLDDHD